MRQFAIIFKLQKEIDLSQYTFPEISETIVAVLESWDYNVTKAQSHEFIFESGNGYLPRQEAVLLSHYGSVAILKEAERYILELKYTVGYLPDIFVILWIIYIAKTSNPNFYWFIALMLVYFIYRLFIIRKKCKLMLIQIVELLN
ncbi:hypothetical protein [Mucilaginibacter segetis]|uniref:Uncharacterized protein n=1 Tax=Mucilaginibacter segetis TaxID=2793071 RepID=A0A934UMF4_9SPHI|nr:hypothetical protein [Mucilaginibacter segetis]MBK0378831.1 hypothetical protein [Mucilaginibacter segetis]